MELHTWLSRGSSLLLHVSTTVTVPNTVYFGVTTRKNLSFKKNQISGHSIGFGKELRILAFLVSILSEALNNFKSL